jgi:hypothetical protein
MTILCDRGTHLGIMATNITNNFTREVKPQQLRFFFNTHVCILDNIDLFYQHYYENVLMQQPVNFLSLNMGIYSPESIKKKCEWIKKWTKAEHRTFAECFVAFTAATMIFKTVNTCTADAFESIDVLCGLIEATNLVGKHTEVLEDFANLVHNELLIHAAALCSVEQRGSDLIRNLLALALALFDSREEARRKFYEFFITFLRQEIAFLFTRQNSFRLSFGTFGPILRVPSSSAYLSSMIE